MGNSSWKPSDWTARSTVNSSRPASETFTSRTIDPALDPKNFTIRESRDSAANPKSTPLIVALDCTGSMGMLAHHIAKEGLGTLVGEVLHRKPITDPHFMFMGVGDASCDRAPIQVTQFEADITILDQVEKIYLEGGGGGNDHESYDFPWLVAAARCKTDAWEKRGKKGYLFTVGDEMPPRILTHAALQRFMGEGEGDISARQSLEMAQRCWEVYHIVVAEGSYARPDPMRVYAAWQGLLNQHVILLDDHTRLAEVIVSALQVAEGEQFEAVVKSWSEPATARIVRDAVKRLPPPKGSGRATLPSTSI